MCKVLKISRNGYYAWFHRKVSLREKRNEKLKIEIKQILSGVKNVTVVLELL